MLDGYKEEIIFFGIIFFLGLTLGWFCRKLNPFITIIALFIFAPILNILAVIDHWFFTLPFVLGVLVHTAKPIYNKITKSDD